MNQTRRLLVIGGSGFVSGTLARDGLARGYQVWTVTRGQRPAPEGVVSLIADRSDPAAFARAIESAGVHWDLAVDCIAYGGEEARQDVALLRERCAHLALISSDFAYDPARRDFPQTEDNLHFLDGGYGGGKRAAEVALLQSDAGAMRWTALRPCHIYGPGSQLGCFPTHGRDPELLERLRRGEPLALVGAGTFLQQPLYVHDLTAALLACDGNARADGQILQIAGPEIVPSWQYYQIIADVLGVALHITEVPLLRYREEHPEHASFLCHRIYDLARLAEAGLPVPSTPLAEGLRAHVESML